MTILPYTSEGYELLHEGAIALAEVEANGMAIDPDYIRRAGRKILRKVKTLTGELENTNIAKEWRKIYRSKTNFDSGEQLGAVLFDHLGFTSPGTTEGGIHKTDEEALLTVNDPFVPLYIQRSKLGGAAESLISILRENVDGFVHCFFNLHSTRTFRSSSENFNFQNLRNRDPITAPIIRRAFRARPGRHIVEIDYSGAEVRVGACYHKDPRMMEYILDKSKDMHRDMAMELYLLPIEEITKEIRHRAKNMFVFPEFYGDWYIDCARQLWGEVPKLKTASGVPLATHLQAVGLFSLGKMDPKEDPKQGTFEHHVQQVEKDFWENRFAVYTEWKKEWYAAYKEKGFFQTLTGFVCQGYMKRNDVINYPVQGSAFHCLLWALTRIVNKELRRKGMKSLVVGQIHDSMVGDVVPGELDDYLHLCHRVMTVLLRRHFPWLIAPMEIEADVAPQDGSWADKKSHPIPE